MVKLTAPDEPLPTIATIVDDDTTVNELTAVPPNVNVVVPSKLVPVILINAPVAAIVGEKEMIDGGGM